MKYLRKIPVGLALTGGLLLSVVAASGLSVAQAIFGAFGGSDWVDDHVTKPAVVKMVHLILDIPAPVIGVILLFSVLGVLYQVYLSTKAVREVISRVPSFDEAIQFMNAFRLTVPHRLKIEEINSIWRTMDTAKAAYLKWAEQPETNFAQDNHFAASAKKWALRAVYDAKHYVEKSYPNVGIIEPAIIDTGKPLLIEADMNIPASKVSEFREMILKFQSVHGALQVAESQAKLSLEALEKHLSLER